MKNLQDVSMLFISAILPIMLNEFESLTPEEREKMAMELGDDVVKIVKKYTNVEL